MKEFHKKTVGFVNDMPVTLIGKSDRGMVFTQTKDGVTAFQDPGIINMSPGKYVHHDRGAKPFLMTVCDCVQPQTVSA